MLYFIVSYCLSKTDKVVILSRKDMEKYVSCTAQPEKILNEQPEKIKIPILMSFWRDFFIWSLILLTLLKTVLFCNYFYSKFHKSYCNFLSLVHERCLPKLIQNSYNIRQLFI